VNEPADHTDAIVVGTGFGGAVTACRLAQAGFSVRVLERGRRYEAHDFPALPEDPALMPDFGRWTWKNDQGLWDVVDLEEVVSVQAAGYGGGSLIYANVHLRPPDRVFDARWPTVYRDPETLREFFDLAAWMLDVAPITEHQFRLTKSEQLAKVAAELGREDAFFHPPLAVSRERGPNRHGKEQGACTGCGGCCTGCPEAAKNTLDMNYLAIAERRGARIATQCEVLDIARRTEGWAVRCLDHLKAQTHERFTARHLFLCAGSVHSTRLLARAKLPSVETRVGIGYFPGGDALGVVYDTETPQYPSSGPTITTATVRWNPADRSSFFLVQDGGYARELERLVGILRAPAWVGRNRLTARGTATVGASEPPTDPASTNPAARRGVPLPSPVDALLDGLAHGDFRGIATPELRATIGSFLQELKYPLLLPAVVERTIDESIRAQFETGWLRWLKPLRRLVTAIQKSAIRWAFGSSDQMADRALRAALAAGGLPRAQVAAKVLNYDAAAADRRTMLLAMGRDAASGLLHYDASLDRFVADLDLFHLAPGYCSEELLMMDVARALGGELRTNPAWAFLGKPVTVHNQGGCPMSDEVHHGVTDDKGKVHGHDDLYVLDGAILCTSVGVNPSATITAIAERNILEFIREHPPGGGPRTSWPDVPDPTEGALEYKKQREEASAWAAGTAARWVRSPPVDVRDVSFRGDPLGLRFTETMQGYYSPTDVDPDQDDARYRQLETDGRPAYPLKVTLEATIENLAAFFEDHDHAMKISGTLDARLPGEPTGTDASHPVEGTLKLFVPRNKPYGLKRTDDERRLAHERLLGADRKYLAGPDVSQRDHQRFLTYALTFSDGARQRWSLDGYKRMRDEPGANAWRDTTSLLVKLSVLPEGVGAAVRGAGVVHVDLAGFLYGQLPSIKVTGTDDPARIAWATAKFGTFFFGSLQRIYVPGVGKALETFFRLHPGPGR